MILIRVDGIELSFEDASSPILNKVLEDDVSSLRNISRSPNDCNRARIKEDLYLVGMRLQAATQQIELSDDRLSFSDLCSCDSLAFVGTPP